MDLLWRLWFPRTERVRRAGHEMISSFEAKFDRQNSTFAAVVDQTKAHKPEVHSQPPAAESPPPTDRRTP